VGGELPRKDSTDEENGNRKTGKAANEGMDRWGKAFRLFTSPNLSNGHLTKYLLLTLAEAALIMILIGLLSGHDCDLYGLQLFLLSLTQGS